MGCDQKQSRLNKRKFSATPSGCFARPVFSLSCFRVLLLTYCANGFVQRGKVCPTKGDCRAFKQTTNTAIFSFSQLSFILVHFSS